VEDHIDSVALVGAPHLGTASALMGLLAGDAQVLRLIDITVNCYP
jgi:hypothetical protein